MIFAHLSKKKKKKALWAWELSPYINKHKFSTNFKPDSLHRSESFSFENNNWKFFLSFKKKTKMYPQNDKDLLFEVRTKKIYLGPAG